MKVIRSR